MSLPLLHSPAHILQRLLIALGLGTAPPPPVAAWPVYRSHEPNLPDNCITVYSTEGQSDGYSQIDGEDLCRRGVQVRVRAETDDVGAVKAEAIAHAFDQIAYDEEIAIGASAYVVHVITRTGNVIALGRDAPDSDRRLFTINAVASITRRS